MPIYEYLCKDCGERFEVLRQIKEADSPVPCKSCHSDKTQRALSVFFAQSSSQLIAGGNSGSCASCSGGTCSTCHSN
jgi:putative FmdB family regulatory protein